MPDILKAVADNKILYDALQEHFKKHFQWETMTVDDTVSDIRLGQIYRARLMGLESLERAFKDIMKLKAPLTQAERMNNAR